MSFLSQKALVLSCVLVVSVYTTLAQETPHVVFDFALFKLRIIETTKENEISNEERAIRPGTGQQLVVITLEGKSPFAANPVYVPGEFAVAYEQHTSFQGNPITTRAIRPVLAIAMHNNDWTIADADDKLLGVIAYVAPGTFRMRLATVIPDDVKTCSVIIPTLATGAADVK